MLKKRQDILDTIEKWLISLKLGDTESAAITAASLRIIGADLCNHAEFRKIAKSIDEDMDATQALDGATWLLLCITEMESRK